jgi:hypothetical protein
VGEETFSVPGRMVVLVHIDGVVLFLSLVVWLSWSMLMASYEKALELVTGCTRMD